MVILLQCSDRVGLVANISKVMADANLNIISMREYVNTGDNRFYIRVQIEGGADVDNLKPRLLKILPADTQILINPLPGKKVILLVTKEYHCLGDILLRNHFNTLGATVQAVIGNHDDLKTITQKFDIPFFLVSHLDKSRETFENEILGIIKDYEPHYLVLAKFMRILSPEFIANYPMRIINIHHSFLPAFAGASPYRQAYDRGVKLIGATAHFVTDKLDDGPIISQQTIAVNHAHTVGDMITLGKEIEKSVLAKALQLVFEDKVMVHQNKTIVFEL